MWVLGIALATSPTAEVELTDAVESVDIGLGALSGSWSGAKKSNSNST